MVLFLLIMVVVLILGYIYSSSMASFASQKCLIKGYPLTVRTRGTANLPGTIITIFLHIQTRGIPQKNQLHITGFVSFKGRESLDFLF